MVTAVDEIGIVPEKMIPGYCFSLFPGKNRIIDFMDLGYNRNIIPCIFNPNVIVRGY